MANDFFVKMKDETGVQLNDVQKEAVLHSTGPLLLLASPGSGKTTTLNMKIGYLILEKGYQPSKILAVTFSRASAQDMRERFDRFFPALNEESVNFSTIHSFSFTIVREFFFKTRQSFQIIEGDMDKDKIQASDEAEEGVVLHKKWVLRQLFKEVAFENITDDQMEELLTYISYIKNKLIPLAEIEKVKTSVEAFAEVYRAYEAFKQKDPSKLLVDFDDMLTIAYNALQQDDQLLKKYQDKFDYILTDESQDTSLVQNKIIELLAKPHQNLCVVGDLDQCIYAWRGAEPQYLLDFETLYPHATIMKMEQNYRSSQEVVELANQFIKRNKDRYDMNMFTNNEAVKPIELKKLGTYDEQIVYVVEEIGKVENLKEVAVLYRNNSSSIALINALDYAGIPYYMKDSDNKFFSHWVVEDILNFMRFSYSDKNVTILERIHTKFAGYISKQQIEYLKKQETKESVFDALKKLKHLPDYQRENLRKFKAMFKEMNTMTPKKAIQFIRAKLGYEKSLVRMSESLGFKKEYLFGILNTLEGIAGNLETLKDFADRLKYLENALRTSKFNKHKNAITLSTFHSSKGLEYERVYMIDLVNGVIPTNDAIKAYEDGVRDEMEEAVRLFYVGMTRAKQHLELLTYRKKDKEAVMESTFLRDVKKLLNAKLKNEKPKAVKVSTKLPVGTEVEHNKFGAGEVIEVENDTATIQFENGMVKNLLISICLQKGLIKVTAEA